MAKLAIVGCGELVTMNQLGAKPGLGLVRDGALIVSDGRIVATGTREAIAPLIDSNTEVMEAGGRLVMPGLVDAHTHPVFGGNRADEFAQRAVGKTYREIAESGGGIMSTVCATRSASEEALLGSAQRHASWFLRNGTTTIEAKSGYGLTLGDELRLLRAIRTLGEQSPLTIVPTFLGAHAVPQEHSGDADSYVDLVVNEMLPEIARLRLAEYCDVFCEPGYFDIQQSRRVLTAATRLGLKLRVHADQLSLSGGALLAAELGAVTADHLEYLDATGMVALKREGVIPVLLPASVFALGQTKYANARAMLDMGLEVVLATDFNPGSSPTPSLPFVMSLACTQMSMTPEEAIRACTISAAKSLGLSAELGSLECGKRADFVIFDCESYNEVPYWMGVELVSAVYVNGVRAFCRDG